MAKLRRRGKTREATLLLICCEGALTEPQYFAHWSDYFPRVKIYVVSPESHKSAPSGVLEKAKSEMRKLRFEKDDQTWIVTDRDRWQGKQLALLHRETRLCSFKLATSNPNFELWLLAHFEPIGQPFKKEDIELRLRSHLGSFNKLYIDHTVFGPRINRAISNAKAADSSRLHATPGTTRVYLLAQELNRLTERN